MIYFLSVIQQFLFKKLLEKIFSNNFLMDHHKKLSLLKDLPGDIICYIMNFLEPKYLRVFTKFLNKHKKIRTSTHRITSFGHYERFTDLKNISYNIDSHEAEFILDFINHDKVLLLSTNIINNLTIIYPNIFIIFDG